MSGALDRFMAKVSPEPNTGCHLWTGFVNRDGYGRLRRGERMVYAHRFAFEEFVGPIPEGAYVLHRCDTPACVNPEHLFVGTQADNVRDRDRKGRGRWPTGEGSPTARLTAVQVAEIRDRVANGATQTAVAAEYGVSQAHVSTIVHGKSWRL